MQVVQGRDSVICLVGGRDRVIAIVNFNCCSNLPLLLIFMFHLCGCTLAAVYMFVRRWFVLAQGLLLVPVHK